MLLRVLAHFGQSFNEKLWKGGKNCCISMTTITALQEAGQRWGTPVQACQTHMPCKLSVGTSAWHFLRQSKSFPSCICYNQSYHKLKLMINYCWELSLQDRHILPHRSVAALGHFTRKVSTDSISAFWYYSFGKSKPAEVYGYQTGNTFATGRLASGQKLVHTTALTCSKACIYWQVQSITNWPSTVIV